MVPMHDTPLGPLADGLTLRQIGLRDRLRELDFEFPLAGGDLRGAAPDISLSDVGECCGQHLAADDPLASYADRLTADALGRQSLRGYLSAVRSTWCCGCRGSATWSSTTRRTGWATGTALTAADYDRPRLTEAMLHSDYPLQALL